MQLLLRITAVLLMLSPLALAQAPACECTLVTDATVANNNIGSASTTGYCETYESSMQSFCRVLGIVTLNYTPVAGFTLQHASWGMPDANFTPTWGVQTLNHGSAGGNTKQCGTGSVFSRVIILGTLNGGASNLIRNLEWSCDTE